MSTNTDILAQFFSAINRNDIQAAVQYCAPDIVRIEPKGYDTSGTHHGTDALSAHLAQGRGTWAEGSCDPEEFRINGSKVVVYLHARVRLKDTNEWIDGRFADGFVLRDGKIIHYQTFWERSDALLWADIDD